MVFKTMEDIHSFTRRVEDFIRKLLYTEDERRKAKNLIKYRWDRIEVNLIVGNRKPEGRLVIQVLDDYHSADIEVKFLKKTLDKFDLGSRYSGWGYQNLPGSMEIRSDKFDQLDRIMKEG